MQRIPVQKSNFFRWKCGPWHFLTRHQNIAQKISAEQSSENRYLVFRSTNLQRETTTQQFGSKCSKCSGFLNMGRWVLSLLREAVGVFSACLSYLRRNSTKPWIVFSPNPPAAHSLEAGATQIRWFGRTPKTIVNLLHTRLKLLAHFTFGFDGSLAFMNCSNVLVHVTLFRTAVFTNIALV